MYDLCAEAMKLKKKKILVTGAMGFIGSNLTPVLTKKHTVILCDKKLGNNIFDTDFELYVRQADVVIHLAALVDVQKSFENPDDTFITNALGTARVAQLCTKFKKKLVFVSSAAVHDPESSPYAYSKKLAEDIVWGVRRKIPVVVLRLYNVYGEGANKRSAFYRFLTDPKITINGDGQQTRDFISVEDVCAIIEDSIKNKWDDRIVEVGTGEAQAIEFVAELFRFYRQSKRIYYARPVKEVRSSKANTLMLNSLYKEELKTDIFRDIERMVKKYKKSKV